MRPRRANSLVQFVLLAVPLLVAAPLVAGCGLVSSARDRATSAAPVPPGQPGSATVTRVIDGDTIVVALGGHDERVRLIGIDTPETVSPVKPVQCYGKQASNHTKALLPPGTAVRLVRDVEARDVYGRLLAYVYRAIRRPVRRTSSWPPTASPRCSPTRPTSPTPTSSAPRSPAPDSATSGCGAPAAVRACRPRCATDSGRHCPEHSPNR